MIDTSWAPEVAIVEIQKRLGQPQLFGWGETAPFVGELKGNAFRFRRRKIPMVKGTGPAVIDAVVEPSHHNGASIRVKIRLNVPALLSLPIFLAFFAFAVLNAQDDSRWAIGTFACCWLLFFFGLTTIMFASQASKAEGFLREIFASAPALPEPVETGIAYR